MKLNIRKRISGIIPAVILIGIVLFLSSEVAYSLYEPDHLTAEQPDCDVVTINGDVMILQKGSLSWTAYDGTTALEPGSRLRTTSSSQASVMFGPGTTTTLEPDTDLIIDTIDRSDDTVTENIILKQRAGLTWTQVDGTVTEKDFVLKTPDADIEVHGTSFSAEIDEEGTTIVSSMQGMVEVSAEGETVEVNEGFMTEVRPGETPIAPYPMPVPVYELVLTADGALAPLVTAPGGAQAGYLSDGSTVNQISGTLLDASEDGERSIHLTEPGLGDYTVTVDGEPDGSGSIRTEGFIKGEPVFENTKGVTLDDSGKTVVDLHYDALSTVFDPASTLIAATVDETTTVSNESDQTITTTTNREPVPVLSSRDLTNIIRWPIIGFIVVMAGVLFFVGKTKK